MNLSLNNLRDVRRLLYPIQLKWYDIGIELGLKVTDLDYIKIVNNSDPTKCLTEMLKVWLKSIDPSPTWKALGIALEASPVHEVELATKIGITMVKHLWARGISDVDETEIGSECRSEPDTNCACHNY